MGYQMIYHSTGKEKIRKNFLRMRTMIAASVLIFSITVRIFWTAGTEQLQTWFLPGDETVTEAAFLVLTEDLRSGASVSDSLERFCRSVLNEEN